MRFLFDTCTVSDFVKAEPGVLVRIKETTPDLIAVSVITRMELEYGLLLNPARAKKLSPTLAAFLASITVLPFDNADAMAAAAIRTSLHKRGQPIGAYDFLIAGCAMARGLVMVTSNVGEFQRVSGLQVENWRQI